MNIYRVEYTGNSKRFKGGSWEVYANTAREAVITFYCDYLHENCFFGDDDRLFNMDGEVICDFDCDRVKYDGGYFVAELIEQL
jgi:hypothetical protein